MCIRDRNNGDMMTKNNGEIIKEVSDNSNNELTSCSGKIVEKGVSKGDTMEINSDDENTEIVGHSERVVGVGGSEGVEISVYKLEREYESLSRNMGQRVNFPRVYGKTSFSQVFLKDK